MHLCGNDKAAVAAPAAKAYFEETNEFMEAVPLKVRNTARGSCVLLRRIYVLLKGRAWFIC